MQKVDEIAALLKGAGALHYGMEAVTQLDHALQAAMHAERAGASPALITAALLHDIGHLVGTGDEGLAETGTDAEHEKVAARWLLEAGFSAAVVEPIRMHVDAKRYLCHKEDRYLASLSQASKTSLIVQGGVFTAAEAAEFAGNIYAGDAVILRRWDDKAKTLGLKTPSLDHYVDIMRQVFQPFGDEQQSASDAQPVI